jgi:hypothetical protein
VGVRGTTSLNDAWDTIFLGGTPNLMTPYAWDGYISEILIYDKELDFETARKVSAYLGQKWGFKSSLTTPYNNTDVYYPIRSGPLVSSQKFTA